MGIHRVGAAVVVVLVVVGDLATKSWALRALSGRSMDLFGGWVPLNLAFNQGAAFGLRIGDDPRYVFVPVTLIAIVFLAGLILRAGPGDGLRTGSAALVLGGALGNLYDRVRWDRGVVDFIGPIDLGFMYWPIFNVADMAITVGAILLAIAFWREERRAVAAGEGSGAEASPSAG